MQHSIDTSFIGITSRVTCRKLLESLYTKDNFLDNSDIPDTVLFKTYDKAGFKNYVNRLDQIDFKTHDIGGYYQDILKQDIKLLKLFNEKYHVEKE